MPIIPGAGLSARCNPIAQSNLRPHVRVTAMSLLDVVETCRTSCPPQANKACRRSRCSGTVLGGDWVTMHAHQHSKSSFHPWTPPMNRLVRMLVACIVLTPPAAATAAAVRWCCDRGRKARGIGVTTESPCCCWAAAMMTTYFSDPKRNSSRSSTGWQPPSEANPSLLGRPTTATFPPASPSSWPTRRRPRSRSK